MNIFVSAGEASGDAHAAAFVRALRAARPEAQVRGIGGAGMLDAGVELLVTVDCLQAMGLFESAATVPAHVRALRATARELRARHYDLAVLVDYPGFHRRVAAVAHARGVPVLQYVAPQFWAWGRWRIPAYRRVVTHTAVILPFEEAFLRTRGVAATFVGHPLLERTRPGRDEARSVLRIPSDVSVLGLFPGSRAGERRSLWHPFLEAARRLRAARRDLHVCVAATSGSDLRGIGDLAATIGPAACVAAAADVAIAKSGTTTLELALAGTPHVLAYRMHAWTYLAARRLVAVPWIGLVNLVLERDVVPELVQSAATPEALAAAAGRLFDGQEPATRQRAAFAELPRRLGPANASARVVDLALRVAA